MKSIATARFWKLFRELPQDIQELATKNYGLWCEDPSHPSLRFRRLKGSSDRFTIRVGDRYRAMGRLKDEMVIWTWIGTHADYDQLV